MIRYKLILAILMFFIAFQAQAQTIADSFAYPLQIPWNVTQGFAKWDGDFFGFHLGEDVKSAVPLGGTKKDTELPVFAAANGIVRHVGYHAGYGYVVLVEHSLPAGDPDGPTITTLYAHLRADGLTTELNVTKETSVLGYLSSDKDENGGYPYTHLHFGIRKGSVPSDINACHPITKWWSFAGYSALFAECHKKKNKFTISPEDNIWSLYAPLHASVVAEWADPQKFIEEHSSSILPPSPFYSITDLGVLSGGSTALAFAINKVGAVVGQSEGASDADYSGCVSVKTTKPFIWTATGGIQDLGPSPVHDIYGFKPCGGSATGINDGGSVVGYLDYGFAGRSRPFIWTATEGMRLVPGTGGYAGAAAINNLGQVIGSQAGSAFLWTETDGLKNMGIAAFNSSAYAINNEGEIAGSMGQVRWLPIFWNGAGEVQFMDGVPYAYGSNYAAGINDSGQVVGKTYGDSSSIIFPDDRYYAFFWSPSTGAFNLGDLPGSVSGLPSTVANGINNSGKVIGTSNNRAFLWTQETGMQDLNSLLDQSGTGWTLYSANAINDAGQIVGYGDHNGQSHAFLLSNQRSPYVYFQGINTTYIEEKQSSSDQGAFPIEVTSPLIATFTTGNDSVQLTDKAFAHINVSRSYPGCYHGQSPTIYVDVYPNANRSGNGFHFQQFYEPEGNGLFIGTDSTFASGELKTLAANTTYFVFLGSGCSGDRLKIQTDDNGQFYGYIAIRTIPMPIVTSDLLNQLDSSQEMTNATFPDASLSVTMVGLKTGDAAGVQFYVKSNAGSINWTCQDLDYGNPGPYAYFGSHISESSGDASVMQLRTIPNANQTIHNYNSLKIVQGHTYTCNIFNTLDNGNWDSQNPITSKGNGQNIFFRVFQ